MRYDEQVTKNPFLNALSASAYIALVASIMYAARGFDGPDSFLVPITVLSLFVLSTAVMGFIFFYQPAQMYLDGLKKEAVSLFLKTLAFFACITFVLLALLFLSLLSKLDGIDA